MRRWEGARRCVREDPAAEGGEGEGMTAASACVIRRATLDDAEAISRVVIRSLREPTAADYPAEIIDEVAANFSPEKVRALFSTRAVFVGLLGGRIVGTAGLDGTTV